MTERIRMSELQHKIDDPHTDDAELAKYLRPDPKRSTPLEPAFTVNEDTVEIDRARLLGLDLASLNTREARRRQSDFERRVSENKTQLRFVAEGDSWFEYPIVLTDIIDNLMRHYPIFDLSAAGDTLKNMMEGLDALEGTIADKKPHGFLFSGGGNDIAGPEFEGYIKGYDARFKPPDYISVSFASFIHDIEGRYFTLFSRLTRKFPKLKIFCHGYDRAIPRPTGPFGVWLWPSLEKKEVPVAMRSQVVGIMIDRFNDMLIRQAGLFSGQVVHIDCRGVVSESRWYDELHPNNPAYADVSGRFKSSIDKELAGVV